MKHALLTGGTGFVGANLARRLLREGHDVHLLVRAGHHPWRIADVRTNLRLHVVDLADREQLERTVATIRPEWVFHLAAYGAYPAQTDVDQMLTTNVVATANLVQACLKSGFEAFVNTGSSSEYGRKNHPPAETEWLEPNSHYAVTKASATLFCRYTGQREGLPIVTLRLYSAYGPYEEPTRLLPTLIARGLAGELPPLADPDVARDFVAVADVEAAYLLAASRPGQEPGAVYNVGTGVQTTLREVVEVARRTLGLSVEPTWGTLPNRRWDTSVWVADSRLIQQALDWRPRVSLEDGFRQLVDWLRGDPALLAFYRRRQRHP